MRCLATKEVKTLQCFKYMNFVLPWKQNCAFEKKEFNTCGSLFVYVVLFKHYYANISRFPL